MVSSTPREATADDPLSRTAYTYISAVISLGILVTSYAALSLTLRPVPKQWLVLAGLTLLTGSFSVKIPSVAAKISVSEAFVFASVLLFGPATATVIVALDSFVMSLWVRHDRRSPIRSLFNLSSGALAIWTAASAFYWLSQATPGVLEELLPLERHLWQLFALAALYFLINSALIAIALGFERGANPARLWWENFPWFSLNYFGGVSVAALLVSYTRSVDLSAIGIILPLLLISYFTYRAALGRIEDSRRHVEHVNELYMSTIEALAMAVDAKDQITHGHIRRVQVFAVELAKRLGVSDESQLKAIETAALLHDMGKLAIPEHILNKPGKLTEAEFDKMKRHADIGADLLSSIKFPYPVVPIVRHHHEFWNGGGYPAGIAGTDIPLGARVLSVVDCFDALNSDRPYRPRLSPDEAFAILKQRRGSMYDPLVVDTFISVYSDIAPRAIQAGHEARSLFPLGLQDSSEDPAALPLAQIRANSTEAAGIDRLQSDLLAAPTLDEKVSAVAQCLREITAASVFAYFEYDRGEDALRCRASYGPQSHLLKGFKIRIGERVSGWCASTCRSSLNADAMLDLRTVATAFTPALKSTACTAVSQGDLLLGVLTAYATQPDAFSDENRYSLERVAATLAEALVAARGGERERLIRFRALGNPQV